MKISIIGAGKAAHFLAAKLYSPGIKISQIYNRTPTKGEKLAQKYGAEYVSDIRDVDSGVDAIFFAVSDDHIEKISDAMTLNDEVLRVCLSGTTDLSKLPDSDLWAILWPIFSLVAGSEQKNDIPLVVQYPIQNKLETKTTFLAEAISEKRYPLKANQRHVAHLCAVFANNFVNFLNIEMFGILKAHQLDAEMMYDIMRSTLEYDLRMGADAQITGPAARGDISTITLHEKLLSDDSVLLDVYQHITQAIIDKTK